MLYYGNTKKYKFKLNKYKEGSKKFDEQLIH